MAPAGPLAPLACAKVYIAASLGWLRVVEGAPPDHWDMLDAGVCLMGAAIIL